MLAMGDLNEVILARYFSVETENVWSWLVYV